MSKDKTITLLLAPLAAIALAGCGGSGSITASAAAKCARARHRSTSTIASGTPSQDQVLAKIVPGGWLYQSYGDETEAERHSEEPGWELYVFKDNQTAEEAFNIVSNAVDPKQNSVMAGRSCART